MKTGDRIEKPWGWEQILDLNERYCIKHLFVEPGHRLSVQYHEFKRETLLLVSGGADLLLHVGTAGERMVALDASQPQVIEPGTVHRIACRGDVAALVLEVSSPEVDDVVRLADDYGRAPGRDTRNLWPGQRDR
jgi:mannose-1-phosphate guanylyltransferase